MVTRFNLDLRLPETISPRLRAKVARESRRQTVIALFQARACSAGLAAKLLGLSLREFHDLLAEYRVSVTDDSDAALAADLDSLEHLDPGAA